MNPSDVALAMQFCQYVESQMPANEKTCGTHTDSTVTQMGPEQQSLRNRSTASPVQQNSSTALPSSSAPSEVPESCSSSTVIPVSSSASDIAPEVSHGIGMSQCIRDDQRINKGRIASEKSAEHLFHTFFHEHAKNSATRTARWLALAKVCRQRNDPEWYALLKKQLQSLDDFLPEDIQKHFLNVRRAGDAEVDVNAKQEGRAHKRRCAGSPVSVTPSAASDPCSMTTGVSGAQEQASQHTVATSSLSTVERVSSEDSKLSKINDDKAKAKNEDEDKSTVQADQLSKLGKRNRSASVEHNSSESRSVTEGQRLDACTTADIIENIANAILNPDGLTEVLKEMLQCYYSNGRNSESLTRQVMLRCIDTLGGSDVAASPSMLHSLFLLTHFSLTDGCKTVRFLLTKTFERLSDLGYYSEFPVWAHAVFKIVSISIKRDVYVLPAVSEECRRCNSTSLVFKTVEHLIEYSDTGRGCDYIHFLASIAPHTLHCESNVKSGHISVKEQSERVKLAGWLFQKVISAISDEPDRKHGAEMLQMLVRCIFLGCEGKHETAIVSHIVGMMLYCIVRWQARTPSRNSAINGGEGLESRGILPSVPSQDLVSRIRQAVDVSFVQSSLGEEFSFFVRLDSCEPEKFVLQQEKVQNFLGMSQSLLKALAKYATRCICMCVLPREQHRGNPTLSASTSSILWHCACAVLTAEPFHSTTNPNFSKDCWNEVVTWCMRNGNVSASQRIFAMLYHAMIIFTGVAASFCEFGNTLKSYLIDKIERVGNRAACCCLANASLAAVDVLSRLNFSFEIVFLATELAAIGLAIGFNASWYNTMTRLREKALSEENVKALCRNSGTYTMSHFTRRCMVSIIRGRSVTDQYGLTDKRFCGSISTVLLIGSLLDSQVSGLLTDGCLNRMSSQRLTGKDESTWPSFLGDVLSTSLQIMSRNDTACRGFLIQSVKTIVAKIARRIDPVMRGISSKRYIGSSNSNSGTSDRPFLTMLDSNANNVLYDITRITGVSVTLRGRLLSNDLTYSTYFLKLLDSITSVRQECMTTKEYVEAVSPLLQIYVVVLKALADFWRGTTSRAPLGLTAESHSPGTTKRQMHLNAHIIESLSKMGMACSVLSEKISDDSNAHSVIHQLLPLLNAQGASDLCYQIISNLHSRLCYLAKSDGNISSGELEKLGTSILDTLIGVLQSPDLASALTTRCKEMQMSQERVFRRCAELHRRLVEGRKLISGY